MLTSENARVRRGRLASFLVPVVTVVTILYQPLTELQVGLTHPETLSVVGSSLAGGVVLGLAAAFGRAWLRVLIFAGSALLLVDVGVHLPEVFRPLDPAHRALVARDRQRIADLATIRTALEAHIRLRGGLPRPSEYGEGVGPSEFWMNWWDASAHDGNGDGRPFLEFLVDAGVIDRVPVDPENRPPADGDPRQGRQYVYFVVPPDYDYAGGTCVTPAKKWVYLLAITDLEQESVRPPVRTTGSGCGCLWRDQPDFFQQHFDYVLCGTFGP